AEGGDRPPLVAGHLEGRRRVRHGDPVDAEMGAELGPVDLAVAGDEDEEVVVLGESDHEGLDDVGRPHTAGLGRRVARAPRAVPDDRVLDPALPQGLLRALLALAHAPQARPDVGGGGSWRWWQDRGMDLQ